MNKHHGKPVRAEQAIQQVVALHWIQSPGLCVRKARRGSRSLQRAHAQRDRGLGEAGGQGEAFSWLTKASSTVLQGWMACIAGVYCIVACRRPIHCARRASACSGSWSFMDRIPVGSESRKTCIFAAWISIARIHPRLAHRCHADPVHGNALAWHLCVCICCILLLMTRTFTCSRFPCFQRFRPKPQCGLMRLCPQRLSGAHGVPNIL